MPLADDSNVFDDSSPHIVLLISGDVFDMEAHAAGEKSSAIVHLTESISETALQYMRLLRAGVELRAVVSDLFIHRTSQIISQSGVRNAVGGRTAFHLFEKCQYAEQGYDCLPGRFVLYTNAEKPAKQALAAYDTTGQFKLQSLSRVEITLQSMYSLEELLEVLAAPGGWTGRDNL